MKSLFRGKILDRRYRIVRTLAKGGFGETYIAEDTRLPGNPWCVVKHLKPGNSNTTLLENAKRLFSSEAETLQKLGRHNQIPQLLAYFEENREFYLVQELIEGHTLTRELISGRLWSDPQICLLLQEICTILAFVHGQGVIHRDIKPDNILRRTHDQKLVLVDFGTVKQVVAQNHISTTIIAGTPGYMPTEQGRGKPRPTSDLYALGIIGIQAATGLKPAQLQEDANTGEIQWQPWAKCSEELAAILSKMVRYHFKERYQTAEAVLQDVERLLSSFELPVPVPDASIDAPSAEILAEEPQTTTFALPAPIAHSDRMTAIGSLVESLENPTALPTLSLNTTEISADTLAEPTAILQTSLSPVETVLSNPLSASTDVAEPLLVQTALSEAPLPTPPIETMVSQPPNSSADLVLPSIVDEESIDRSSDTVVLSPHYPDSSSSPEAHTTLIAQPASAPQSTLLQNDRQVVSPRRFRWLLGIGAVGVAISAIASSTYLWQQRQAYLKQQQILQDARTQQVQRSYLVCIQQAQTVPQQYTDLYKTAQILLGDCQLALAQQMAQQSRFREAIVTASQISLSHAAYQQAQPLLAQWAKSILKRATDRYQGGKLDEAVAIASAIPQTSSIYFEAQAAIKKWNQEWKTNDTYFKAIQKSLKEGRWESVLAEAKKLTTTYWQQKVKPIVQQANTKIAAANAARSLEAQESKREDYASPPASYSSGGSGSSGSYSSGGADSGYSAPVAPPAGSGSSGGGWGSRRW
ncbi:serine/threonine protein kinase [Phormidium tenue FACHB-886]|nr:serine/threonine protein kinase [Phormidium tenue FACHB-886]